MPARQRNARPKRGGHILAVLALLALLLAACGSSKHAPSPTAQATPSHAQGAAPIPRQGAARRASIAISSFSFHPADLTVARGTTITFTNHDSTAHTATSTANPAAFDSGAVQPGQSKTITLSKPGTYPYYCQFHPFMRGTITVR